MDFPLFSLIQRQGPAYIDHAKQRTADVSAELLTAVYLIQRSRLRSCRALPYVVGDVREGTRLCDKLRVCRWPLFRGQAIGERKTQTQVRV